MSSTTSLLFQQLAYAVPVLVVYLLGLILAVIFIKKYPGPAILTLIGIVILTATIFGISFTQAYLNEVRITSGWPFEKYSQTMSLVSLTGSIMRALGSALLVAAIFVGRKSKTIIQP
jgi:hypothetical protein